MVPTESAVVHIYGEPNAGRTYFLLGISRELSEKGYTTIYYPAKIEFSNKNVNDIEEFYIINTTTIDEIFESMSVLMDKQTNPFVFIIDDLSLMRASFEKDIDDLNLKRYILRFSELCRLVIPKLKMNNSILLLTTQIRTQINQQRTTTQLSFINDLADIIHELRIVEKHPNSKIISVKTINKISDSINIDYLDIQLR